MLPIRTRGWGDPIRVAGLDALDCHPHLFIGISTLCFFGLGIFRILAGIYLLKARHLLDEIPSIDSAWEEVLNKLRGYFMMLGLFTVLHLGLIAFLIFYNFGIRFLGNFR
jgi:hypothetical protein